MDKLMTRRGLFKRVALGALAVVVAPRVVEEFRDSLWCADSDRREAVRVEKYAAEEKAKIAEVVEELKSCPPTSAAGPTAIRDAMDNERPVDPTALMTAPAPAHPHCPLCGPVCNPRFCTSWWQVAYGSASTCTGFRPATGTTLAQLPPTTPWQT